MAGKSTAAVREEGPALKKKPSLKAVVARPKLVTKVPSTLDTELWGTPPAGVSMFGILRKNDVGVGERKRFEQPGTGVDVAEWPLSELDVPTIRKRWGGGTYTAIWLGVENGTRRGLGRGRKVVLRDDAERLEAQAKAAESASGVAPPAPAPVPPVMPAGGVGPQETITMFMSMWSALQDTNRHAMTLERESYESRLKLQQDFYKEVTLLKTTGNAKGGGDLEKKVDAIIQRLDEEEDDEQVGMARQGSGPVTIATIFAQHLPSIMEHIPAVLSLARDALKNRKGVSP